MVTGFRFELQTSRIRNRRFVHSILGTITSIIHRYRSCQSFADFPPRRLYFQPVRSCGICDGQSGTGEGFLRVLRFPLPIFIPPTAPHSSSSIIWGWYNRPVVAAVPSGLSLIPLRIIKNNTPLTRIYH
jgi:hypothetical protein